MSPQSSSVLIETQSPPSKPPELSPNGILQIGLGFMAAKTLLSAVELGVFTELAQRSLTVGELTERLGLHPRGAQDFLDALVALGLLERQGGRYTNTAETDYFLDRNKPSYVGGIVEMANDRLYPIWGSLSKGLRTGQPQNEIEGAEDLFTAIYSDPGRLKLFLSAMTGISFNTAWAIAQKFPWKKYQTFIDIGAAQGSLPVQVALAHPHLTGGGFDLAAVKPIFEDYVAGFDLSQRLRFYAGDFFSEPLPTAEVLVMGHILHDWNLEEKQLLIAKAYEALPKGGVLLIYEALIDDDRRENVQGLLMSLNMLLETRGGFDYTGADCCGWLRQAGFRETYVEHLTGSDSMVVGIK